MDRQHDFRAGPPTPNHRWIGGDPQRGVPGMWYAPDPNPGIGLLESWGEFFRRHKKEFKGIAATFVAIGTLGYLQNIGVVPKKEVAGPKEEVSLDYNVNPVQDFGQWKVAANKVALTRDSDGNCTFDSDEVLLRDGSAITFQSLEKAFVIYGRENDDPAKRVQSAGITSPEKTLTMTFKGSNKPPAGYEESPTIVICKFTNDSGRDGIGRELRVKWTG